MGGELSWIKAEVLGMVVAATLFGQALGEKSMTDKVLTGLIDASAVAQGPQIQRVAGTLSRDSPRR